MKDKLKGFLADFKNASLKEKLMGIPFVILILPVILSVLATEAYDEGASHTEVLSVFVVNSLVIWGVLLSAILL